MPRKTQTETPKSTPKQEPPKFKGFANYTLTASDKERFALMAEDYGDAQAMEDLERFIEMDYKVTLSKDVSHKSYLVALTCMDPNSPNAGLCLTTRGKDATNAIAMAAYKHFEVLKENWSKIVQPPDVVYG